MPFSEMVTLFRRHAVPDSLYVTDGGLGAGECVGIERVADGWRLYYSERGSKSPLGTFASEDAACRAMIARIDGMLGETGLPPLE
jgi:hypothetical protein